MAHSDAKRDVTKPLTNAPKQKNGEETERFQERTDAEKLIMSIKIWPHDCIVSCDIFKGTVMQIM